MTETQYRILKGLSEPEVFQVQSPAIIAFNLDKSSTWIQQQLSELVDRGLVERVEKGKYRITDAGRAELADW
jgi:predicted transcriptional regulator of viral defense system